MDSIKNIYKIGLGPSSSHTMGPNRAAGIFLSRYPDAASIKVTLYGSLAATGRGHMTDKAIIRALPDKKVDIIWRSDIVPEFHTNGMLFEAFDASEAKTGEWMVYSTGGGFLSEGRETGSDIQSEQVYRRNSLEEIKEILAKEGFSFWEYVQYHEGDSLWDYLGEVWEAMQNSIREGLEDDSKLPGPLRLKSKAKQYYLRAQGLASNLRSRALVSAYALAVIEMNARGGTVVTAPTCGSCGVVPAVLYHMKTAHNFSDRDILKALATAGLFGNIIKTNASISGAEVGCQGEVGSACVMAAVAVNQLFGGTVSQIETAAEMAMEHNLGLTCDPVGGLVQIPCIERNPMAALRALDVSLYALLSDGRHIVSFDKVIDTMKRTGKDLPSLYKETAAGGLATQEYEKSMFDDFL
ncbi:MAG: L-serine ammonia-lyase, iron-sulfur-dependent, subunit alpha [Bacteroidales bacterium]|nr:L-serine ammonia-lyase, iron-sulfur-dependent, subunit alpha [Candidatus Hennigimonas equi]